MNLVAPTMMKADVHPPPLVVMLTVAAAATATALMVVLWQRRGVGRHIHTGGLRNWGESRCYFNSILQAWAATGALTHTDDGAASSFSVVSRPLYDSIRNVAAALNTSSSLLETSHLADKVLSEFRRVGGTVQGGQQDAHEFLLRLFEAVHREARGRTTDGLTVALCRDPRPRLQPCLVRGNAIGGNWFARSLADPPCWGLLSTSVVCLSCTASSDELLVPFSCLTVVLPLTSRVLTVADCLAEHFRPDFLSGYNCGNCAARGRRTSTDACKLTLAPRLPRVLVIHFSRLPTLGYKNEARVKVEEIIDIARFVRGEWEVERNSPRPPPELYRLSAVIAHVGGAGGGHYICFRRSGDHRVRDGQDTTSAAQWVLASDERVTNVPFSAVQLAGGVYLVVYEAVDESISTPT